MSGPSGIGWRHRIDEVPAPKQKVEIFTKDGDQLQATVVDATDDDPFMGVGCAVGYQTDRGYISAGHVSYWRHIQTTTLPRPAGAAAWGEK